MTTAERAIAPDETGGDRPIPDSAPPGRRAQWGKVIMLALVASTGAACAGVMGPLQQSAQTDLGLTDFRIAALLGTAHGMPALIAALPMGLAIDHLNRARLLLVLGVLWIAGTVLTGLAHGVTSLFIARALVSLGTAGAAGLILSMIADLCAPEMRGRVNILAGIGVLSGPAIAFAGGGALFGYFKINGWSLFPGLAPWRLTMFAFAGLGSLLLFAIALFPEPHRYEKVQRGNAILPALRGLATRWRFLTALWVGSTAAGMSEGAAGLWAAPMLTRNYGLRPDQFGAVMGIMILFAGTLGSILGGVVVDKGNASGRRGGLLIGAVVATLVIIPTTAYPIMSTPTGFYWMLGTMMCACTVMQVTALTTVTIIIPNEERGLCMAITGIVGTVMNMLFVPVISLLGPAIWGDDQHLRQTLVLIGMITGSIGCAGYIVAMRIAPRSFQHA